jgi:hypothetical protein
VWIYWTCNGSKTELLELMIIKAFDCGVIIDFSKGGFDLCYTEHSVNLL